MVYALNDPDSLHFIIRRDRRRRENHTADIPPYQLHVVHVSCISWRTKITLPGMRLPLWIGDEQLGIIRGPLYYSTWHMLGYISR